MGDGVMESTGIALENQAWDFFGSSLHKGDRVVVPWDYGGTLGYKRGVIKGVPAEGTVTVKFIGEYGTVTPPMDFADDQCIAYGAIGPRIF